jgi:hypothetical protein
MLPIIVSFRISSAKKILYNNKKIKGKVIYLNLRKEKKFRFPDHFVNLAELRLGIY